MLRNANLATTLQQACFIRSPHLVLAPSAPLVLIPLQSPTPPLGPTGPQHSLALLARLAPLPIVTSIPPVFSTLPLAHAKYVLQSLAPTRTPIFLLRVAFACLVRVVALPLHVLHPLRTMPLVIVFAPLMDPNVTPTSSIGVLLIVLAFLARFGLLALPTRNQVPPSCVIASHVRLPNAPVHILLILPAIYAILLRIVPLIPLISPMPNAKH